MHHLGAGATTIKNTFETIQEEKEEIEECECTYDEYWDATTAEAYQAMDEFRDAQSELQQLQEQEEMEDYMEWLELQDTDEPEGCSEFEEMIEEARVARRKAKVGKFLSPRSGGDDKVVQSLSPHSGGDAGEVVKPLRNKTGADLPSDYPERTEQEKIDTFKNQDFGRRYERRQEELLQEQTSRAHAAIAGRTSYRVLSDPKNANPGTPSGQDLDF